MPIVVETTWLAKSAERRLDIVNGGSEQPFRSDGAGAARAGYWLVRGEVPEDVVESWTTGLPDPSGRVPRTDDSHVTVGRARTPFVARWTDARGPQESCRYPSPWKPPN